MFYNTSAPGINLLINLKKQHKGETLLVNAPKIFQKGKPKNCMPDECIVLIAGIFLDWKAVYGIISIVSDEESVKCELSLIMSRYVAQNSKDETPPWRMRLYC
ncbi:MAG: N-6 DNA methylase [Methanomicrobiales archaeon]|nr:N-6 DNA methylase [Methanomicrobiales archaeon]